MNSYREPTATSESHTDTNSTTDEKAHTLLTIYPTETDFYALLGLPREPPPSDSAIRSAYRTLTLSFHPDKQPADLKDVATRQFGRITEAYETLLDPQRRIVYDLVGAEGVRREFGRGGVMGRGGVAEREEKMGVRQGRGKEIGVKAMKPAEFKRWFLETMKRRERGVVNSLVRSKGSMTVVVDAMDMIWLDEDMDPNLSIPHLKMSSYGVHYSFVTPFPTLRAVLGEDEKEEDDESEGEDEEEDESPELEIFAGVSGKLQQFFNQVELEYGDGDTETRNVPLPLLLSTHNLTLGAGTSRLFHNPNPQGLLDSLLQDSLGSVQATILPAPTIQASLIKSVTIIPNTRPFNFVFGTVFTRWISHAPPALSLQVTKRIDEKRTAFCTWSSGLIEWPSVIQSLLLPFISLGLDEVLFEDQELSQLQVGLASQGSGVVTPGDEEDEIPDIGDDEQENEYQAMRKKKREENKAAETWHIAASSSPVTNGVMFKYSRNIFSGRAPTEVALSQWSSEKYYSLPPANEPRAVRLEINSTVDTDLSVSWSLHGSRQVSDLTRIGFGVGLQTQGLFMTFSWARLGQKIKLPVAVCAFDHVNSSSATLAILLPWLAYVGVEFGYVRPRERRNRRKLVSRRQRKLRTLVPQKKVEAQQAIELMADQAQRRQDKEYQRGGLVITKAEYGHYPAKRRADNSTREPEVADVTVPVAALVDHSQLAISKKTHKFHLLGFHDPAPLQTKILKIWYKYHGKDHYVEAHDAEGITCPMRVHLLAA